MESEIFSPSLQSSVLEVGYSQRFRQRWPFLVGLFLLFVSGCLVLLWLAFRASFSIPSESALLISVSPRVARSLSSQNKDLLPSLWRRVLESDSQWPVILGAYQRESHWHYFALVPRWHTSDLQVRETKGLVVLISDEVVPPQTRQLRYLDQADWWEGERGAALAFWIDPSLFLPETRAFFGVESQPVVGHYKNHLMTTNIPFTFEINESLKQTDMSVQIPEGIPARELTNMLLEEMRVDILPTWMTDLTPVQMHLNFGSSTIPEALIIVFKETVTQDQARNILGYLGFTERKIISLEDGTIVVESILSKTMEESILFGEKTSRKFGKVQIQGRELRLGINTDFPPLSISVSCQKIKPIGRFSGKLFSPLFPSLIVGSIKNKLSVCLE